MHGNVNVKFFQEYSRIFYITLGGKISTKNYLEPRIHIQFRTLNLLIHPYRIYDDSKQ
jgi:hypothetical protein